MQHRIARVGDPRRAQQIEYPTFPFGAIDQVEDQRLHLVAPGNHAEDLFIQFKPEHLGKAVVIERGDQAVLQRLELLARERHRQFSSSNVVTKMPIVFCRAGEQIQQFSYAHPRVEPRFPSTGTGRASGHNA